MHWHVLSTTLRRVSTVLDSVFPACPDTSVIAPTFPREDMVSPVYLSYVQPFSNSPYVDESYKIGRCSNSFGRLAPLLLVASMKKQDEGRDNTNVDFKGYCVNFCYGESVITTPSCKDHCTWPIERVISTWIKLCDICGRKTDPSLLFRRCCLVGFASDFTSDDGAHVETIGHCITLALELVDQTLTLQIFDYRTHEYVYNVHDQLFRLMRDAVIRQQEYAEYYTTLRTEIVCLKGWLHVDKFFMTCMSAAFRVFMYLASGRMGWHESADDFREDGLNLQRHIFRMFQWAADEPRLRRKTHTVLASLPMVQNVFEVCSGNCYLMIAPFARPKKAVDPEAFVRGVVDSSPRLRYSVSLDCDRNGGFVETTGPFAAVMELDSMSRFQFLVQ